MAKLSVKNLKVELPIELVGIPSEDEITEWFGFHFNINKISVNNILLNTDIKDCKVSFDKILLNGVEI